MPYPKPSIYDLLSARAPAPQKREALRQRHFHTGFLYVEDAWLTCGGGEIKSIVAGMPPTHCDFSYDDRLRNQSGHYLPIARIQSDGHCELELLARARQLMVQHLEVLMPEGENSQHAERDIVIQAPTGVDPRALLDSLLECWPLDKQPKTGLEVTALSFDQWLTSTLEQQDAQAEYLQFIAVEPLGVEEEARQREPYGEMLASLWMRRAPEADGPDAHPTSLKAFCPQYVSHDPRGSFSRRQPSPLDELIVLLDGDRSLDAVAGLIWDGDRSGPRSDHLTEVIQTHLAHLYLDTDVWSVRTVVGGLQSAGPTAQVVLAYQLAQQREGDFLMLDTQGESQTWVIRAQYAQSAKESDGDNDEQLQR